MSLKQKLEEKLKEAMRAQDVVTKQVIRMALTNIKLAEVQKGSPLEDNELLALLQKEIKMRNETILDAQKANREDIIEANKAEIKVIETFLPQQLGETQIKEIVAAAIAEVNAQGMSDMGKVMKCVLPKIQGQASNDMVSKTVRELLNK